MRGISARKAFSSSSCRTTAIVATIFNIALLGFYFLTDLRIKHANISQEERASTVNPVSKSMMIDESNDGNNSFQTLKKEIFCQDSVWCSVPMPKVSHYNFEAPSDKTRWKLAQSQASLGEQVLLERISKVFPHPFDFLDGDTNFRKLQGTIDVFIDIKNDFNALIPGGLKSYTRKRALRDNIQEEIIPREPEYSQALEKTMSRRKLRLIKIDGPKKGESYMIDKNDLVPTPYDFRAAKRAPIVSAGFNAFGNDAGVHFAGRKIGTVVMNHANFFSYFAEFESRIDVPIVLLRVLNENWGWLSTYFPNRTITWGTCCDKNDKQYDNLYAFLESNKTLMVVLGQHNNISHPKLLTYPRGIPLTW